MVVTTASRLIEAYDEISDLQDIITRLEKEKANLIIDHEEYKKFIVKELKEVSEMLKDLQAEHRKLKANLYDQQNPWWKFW